VSKGPVFQPVVALNLFSTNDQYFRNFLSLTLLVSPEPLSVFRNTGTNIAKETRTVEKRAAASENPHKIFARNNHCTAIRTQHAAAGHTVACSARETHQT